MPRSFVLLHVSKRSKQILTSSLKIDLIDMSARPDVEHRWDSSHKGWTLLDSPGTRPLKNKEAKNVAGFLLRNIHIAF